MRESVNIHYMPQYIIKYVQEFFPALFVLSATRYCFCKSALLQFGAFITASGYTSSPVCQANRNRPVAHLGP